MLYSAVSARKGSIMISKLKPIRDYQIGETVKTLNAVGQIVDGVITRKTIHENKEEIRVLYTMHLDDGSVKAVYVTAYRDDVSCE